ncbi:MAG: ABC transporter substrate-binding protein [Acetobacteraceae bacterium]
MPIRRRTLLAAAGAALPRFAIAQSVPELQTLRSTTRSWLWLAEDYGRAGGFFDKAGVKVVSNASNRGTNIAALAGSGPDIVLGDPGEAFNARAQNLAIRSFVQTVGKFSSHVVFKQDVMAKANITETSPVADKIAMLRGLRCGTTGPGGAPDALFRWLALQGGMDPNKDLRLVPIQGGGPGMIAGLQQNVIDGFCLSSPNADLAVSKAGCAFLFDMAANPPPQLARFCYIIASASERTIATKRDALVRYAAGIALALRAIKADPDKFKAFAIPFLELDPAIAERAYASNSKIYFEQPVPDESLFKINLDFLDVTNATQGVDKLPASLTFASVYDTSIAKEAMQLL